jgi:predicted ArsR family transcriptional regulator
LSTARFHLDALCADGEVERTATQRSGVGRPRTGYRSVRGRLDYHSLSEILAFELGDTIAQRRQRAESAGRCWAQRLATEELRNLESAADTTTSDAGGVVADQVAVVTAVFRRLGFDPDLTSVAPQAAADHQRNIYLHACPIRALAKTQPEVACGLHLGLLQGLLTAHDPASSTVRTPRAALEAFVEPELCIATVAKHHGPPTETVFERHLKDGLRAEESTR